MNSNGGNKISIDEIMKRAQEMQERLQKIQQELSEQDVTGTAGGGLVSVTMNGQRVCKKIKIDPSLLKEEISVLEDLILAALNDAGSKAEKQMRDKMGGLSGGAFSGDLL